MWRGGSLAGSAVRRGGGGRDEGRKGAMRTMEGGERRCGEKAQT